jgi:hypothetical protein
VSGLHQNLVNRRVNPETSTRYAAIQAKAYRVLAAYLRHRPELTDGGQQAENGMKTRVARWLFGKKAMPR